MKKLNLTILLILFSIILIPNITLASCLCICKITDTHTEDIGPKTDPAKCISDCNTQYNTGRITCDPIKETTTDSTGVKKTTTDSTGVKKTTTDSIKKNTEPPQTAELGNPIGVKTLPEVVGKVIQAFLGIIGTISLVMFVYGGTTMILATGKAEQIKKGQQTLVWASLGILLVFTSWAILKFVFSAFGL